MKALVSSFLGLALISVPQFSHALGPKAPQSALIDRFSDQAGHLQRRSANASLPAPGAPINFDQGPFITRGLAPDGSFVSYYNFDVQPTTPAPIYALFDSSGKPIDGQHNIVDVIPGDAGYTDFWNVVKVTVPDGYQANQITSVDELLAAGYPQEKTDILVNCPIVPAGSVATQRYAGATDTGLHQGWYKGLVIQYFNFFERALTVENGQVPTSPIFVSFNKNPDSKDPTSGPASGFLADATGRTHNVTGSTPDDAAYSPLWSVNIYDNRDFSAVSDLASAYKAAILVEGAANVNCPIVSIAPSSSK